MAEWVGLGPSAASQQGDWRASNLADLDGWSARIARGERMTEDRTRLTPALVAEDSLVFGLRMNEGVDLPRVRARCPDAPWESVGALLDRLVGEDLAVREGTRLRLQPRGRLLADSIGSELMAAFGARAAVPAVTA
jgi:oxygen-independent coproporphyrinogen-3 oxidase